MASAEEMAESKFFDSLLREKEEQISKMKFVYLEIPHGLQSKYSDSPLMGFSERLGEFKVKTQSSGESFHKKHKLFLGITCAIIIIVCITGLSSI